MNLARNMGGSVGISVVTTMLDRRAQVHLTNLSSHLSASSPALQARLKALGLMWQAHGGGPPGSSPGPWAFIQGAVARQAAMFAYIDCFWLLGVAILLMVPMVFLIKKTKPGGGIAVH
jgi:DHA2 family multidrug resistance protein